MTNFATPAGGFHEAIAKLAVTKTAAFSLQPNGEPGQHQLVARPDTFGTQPEKLQKAAQKFAVTFTPRQSGAVILHGPVEAIAATIEFAKQ